MPKCLVPHVPDHLEGDPVIDDADKPLYQGSQARKQGDQRRKAADLGKIHLYGADDAINGTARQNRNIERQRHGSGGEQDRSQDQQPTGSQKRQHPFHRSGRGSAFLGLHTAASFRN